ncbi:hypothetical protein K1719_031551 [Acacia pycnantha]|nr:hypothetical protein K1719_031551 [Acacia pycnantha]
MMALNKSLDQSPAKKWSNDGSMLTRLTTRTIRSIHSVIYSNQRMSSSSSRRDKRLQADMSELKRKTEDFQVKQRGEDSLDKLEVVFHGPKDSPYKDGFWKIHVDIPPEYPEKPPKLTFANKIFHPNINHFGYVCVNLLSDDWDPSYGLVQIFDQIIPQLLREPNPEEPFNGTAALLLYKSKERFEQRVREHCAKYAHMEDRQSENSEESGSEEDISEEGSRSSQDQSP